MAARRALFRRSWSVPVPTAPKSSKTSHGELVWEFGTTSDHRCGPFALSVGTMTTHSDNNVDPTSTVLRPLLQHWARQSGALSALPEAPVVTDLPRHDTLALARLVRRLARSDRSKPGPGWHYRSVPLQGLADERDAAPTRG